MKHNYFKILQLGIFMFCFNLGTAQMGLTESTYNVVVKDYLNKIRQNYNLSENDLSDLYLNSETKSKSSNVTNLYVNQRYQGIKIFNSVSSIAIKNNNVIYFANNFHNNLNFKINTTIPAIGAHEAIVQAANHFNISGLNNITELSNEAHVSIFTNGNISRVDIPVELVFTTLNDGSMRLSWDLSIYTLDATHWWNIRVDAVTGEVIDFNDWIVSCNYNVDHNHNGYSDLTVPNSNSFNLFKENSILVDGSQYNVFAFPVESPNHDGRTLLVNPANDIASPFGWHDTNGINGAEFTITRGNNVFANEDVNGNNDIGVSPNGTAALNFNFPLNLAQNPVGYQNASLTNLFYVNNVMHDVWYQYGFDELSGNFQQNNYGNGGSNSDSVFAAGQDGASLNNATFGTPPDGITPSMTMYLWSAPSIKNLVTVNTGSISGPYRAVNPAPAPGNNITAASTSPVTADLIVVNDGSLAQVEGCSPLINSSSVAGKIALIMRGTCPFVDKIQNAQNAGAVGVIIMNHNNPTNDPAYVQYVNMAGMTTPAFTIPSVFINYADGMILRNALINGETLNVTLQDYPVFQLDGSFDNSIVSHEYGHGISNRLTGGASNTSCLNNPEQMGEGWSDWFALMMTIKPGDTGELGRGIATYASGQNTNDIGIRPAQYSTDFAIDNITYGATNDDTIIGTLNGQPVSWNEIPHNIGYVWGSILWDLTWAYIDKYGFDADLYNGDGGNNKAMQIVMDGLKLQPCNPGFVTGRNAILAADQALTGGEDQCMIWEVFANRGVGLNASQGVADNMEDQVEDFTTPPSNDPSLANCTSLGINENELKNYKIYPNPTSNEINIKVSKNFGEVKITMFDINGRKVVDQKANLEGTININFGSLQTGIYIMNISGQSININEKIIIN